MAAFDPKQGLMASILDRLIDPATAGSGNQHGYNVSQMMEAVRKDLEELLNTRRTISPAARTRDRVRESILGYGLPDFSAMPVTTVQQREEIARALEATVARYEPRLRDVRVIPLDPTGERHAQLRFRIEARLNVEPGPEVTFDTVSEEAGQYSVQHASKPSES